MSAYKRKLNRAKFFMTLIDEENGPIKKKKITDFLDEGADANEQFDNDSNNTPLHICVINGDIDIIHLLLERGAKLSHKNIDNKTALDIARELNTDVGSKIVAVLQRYEEETQININGVDESEVTTDILSIVKPNEVDPKLVYRKRAHENGFKGQLYESKLLSLVLIRASLNHEFDEFYLGTSLDEIGALDDICIRYKNNGTEGVIFLQAKHRNDVKKNKVTLQDLWRNEGDFSLKKYYNSYSKIRQRFWSKNDDDVFFKGKHEDIKCTYVIYTTAECDFNKKELADLDSVDENARDLINTGDYSNIFKYKYDENEVYLLTNMLIIDHMKYIGKKLAYFISNGKYDMLLDDFFIKKYHVILARLVINVSDVTPAGYRVGTFRKNFLNNHDAKLLVLKLVIYKEFVLAKKPDEAKMKEIIHAVKTNPSKETIIKLMQNALTRFDEEKALVIDDERYKDVIIKRFRFNENYMLCSMSFDMAVNGIMETISFKLPSVFGNIDIAVANGKKGEKRLTYLVEEIVKLFDCSRTESVIIDPGVFGLNGGLGSAVGNLLILDEEQTSLILNTNEKTLGKNALNLLGKLKSRIKNIDDVKFNPCLDSFPDLSLDGNVVQKHNVKTFFNNLWFYSCQSKEDEIEKHAKEAMQDYYIANKRDRIETSSTARYDAIYFIIHNAVQKWWMTEEKSYYLTNDRKYFNSLLKQFSGKSLLNVISCRFVNNMRKYEIKFCKDSVDTLRSQIGLEATVLITEVMILTGIKLVQCYQNLNDYAFIDLNDAACLSKNDYNVIIEELKRIELKVLIIFYKDVTEAKNNIFLRLTEKSFTKNYILVTNEKSAEKLQFYITHDTFVSLRDVNNDLNDLNFTSQEKVLESKFIFQGVSTNFSKVITHDMKKMIKSEILQKIIINDEIYIGKTLTNPYYEDIKDYYVQRSLNRHNSILKKGTREPIAAYSATRNEELIKINTMEALRDTVVIVGAPGMGKSTFLTYLSIQTKQKNPSVWIERINLLDQTKELYRLQENKINISKIDALKFVINAALSTNLIRFTIKPTPIVNFDLDVINGEVVLKNCNEIDSLVLFQLEMFLHCYNRGNTILLFDGFDEICPHYKNEMTEILKCLVMVHLSDTRSYVKQRMWITGRSYNNIRETLETEFGVSYNLEIFKKEEQEDLVSKYLTINMNLNELNMEQFKRIDGFFEFMKLFIGDNSIIKSKTIIKLTSYFLYSLYNTAMKYFYVQINKPQTPDKKAFCEKWSGIFNTKSNCYIQLNMPETSLTNHCGNKICIEEAISLIFTPLHVYIVLEYFRNQIKKIKSTTNENITVKWDLEMNTSSFYEHFIETKLKKIRFEEKNQMDLYNPDIIITYEKELKEFMNKHKKLAFYATFKEDLSDILTEVDIEEIREIIEGMEAGREKTGIVDSILINGVPKFIHLSFQEYLASEYISDLLKSRQIEHVKVWRFISSKITDGVLEFFDRKLEFDDELRNIITERDVKQFIFDDSIRVRDKDVNGMNIVNDISIIDRGLSLGLKQMLKMLLIAMTDLVNISNLDEYITFINKFQFLFFGGCFGWDEILTVILNCIRAVDASKLDECRLGVLQTRSYRDCNNEEIIKDIKWRILRDNNSKQKDLKGRRKSV